MNIQIFYFTVFRPLRNVKRVTCALRPNRKVVYCTQRTKYYLKFIRLQFIDRKSKCTFVCTLTRLELGIVHFYN